MEIDTTPGVRGSVIKIDVIPTGIVEINTYPVINCGVIRYLVFKRTIEINPIIEIKDCNDVKNSTVLYIV